MKAENNIFLTLVENAMQTSGRAHMRPVIEKELLHYDILFALDSSGLLDKLTFQGGTALRLCYGSQRFSEDLDFAGGYDFKTQDLFSMKICLENYLVDRYGLEITVKEPKDFSQEPEERNIKVSKWQIRLVTHPGQKDFPKQMIKIEIANVPAYTKIPRPLMHNYNFMPDGYNNTLIMVETLDEIMSDKLVAFVNCQTYVRYRDIWDLHWLKQQGANINLELINKKIDDYKIKNHIQNVDNMIEKLHSIIQSKEFKDQMSRFLPLNVQENTILNKNYLTFLENEIISLLR